MGNRVILTLISSFATSTQPSSNVGIQRCYNIVTTIKWTAGEYASAAWDPHTVRDKELLDKVQRRGARFVKNDYRSGSSVTEMLTDLQRMLLEESSRNTRLHMLDKIAGGRVEINLEDYVQRINTLW